MMDDDDNKNVHYLQESRRQKKVDHKIRFVMPL